MTITRLISWNVNGIRAVHRKDALLPVFNEKPDILCIQETKAHPDQLDADLLEIGDYHAHYVSAEKKGYSGVAMYSLVQPRSVQNGFGIGRFDSEGRILIAEFEEFTLFNIYYPNGKASKERLQYKLDFYDAFLGVVEEVRHQGRNVVICGDVNTAHKEIDLARPKENETTSGFLPIEREWMDKFVAKGYLDTLRVFNNEPEQYTWWDYKTRARERNVGWRIDYFYINEEFKGSLADAYILPQYLGSDHCPVGIDLELS
jgi:exodeoxyribonuclease-3